MLSYITRLYLESMLQNSLSSAVGPTVSITILEVKRGINGETMVIPRHLIVCRHEIQHFSVKEFTVKLRGIYYRDNDQT